MDTGVGSMITFIRITGANRTRIPPIVRGDDEIRIVVVAVSVQGASKVADSFVHHQVGGAIV